MQVLVLGAGVCGLSCAHDLAQAGHQVEIWARERQLATTSTVAAAIWYPYHARPLERVLPWAMRSLTRFEAIAEDRSAGIHWHRGTEVFPASFPAPAWIQHLPGCRQLTKDALPAGYAQGFEFELPVIETSCYLPWLEAQVLRFGVRMRVRELHSLQEALDASQLVVNCTGLGSRALAQDKDLHAVRGQLLRVAQRGIDRFWFDEHNGKHPTYIIPRAHDVVLGSTAEPEQFETRTEAQALASILERCAHLEPRLVQATQLGTSVGLRPARSGVRLESQSLPGGRVIHNYGHGGGGVTLSWGCAEEVCKLIG